ncbi:hypothetical protein HNY73_020265 [Argiope bruennichi]|uniref:MADF domain-containing protein n=1 Tax=Argiope bruennichi TaxID=94029 RepID=A0A8T0EA01_ARGBR|nr:hypothetical protein HNY73_020265 [Argiope bruennichi]
MLFWACWFCSTPPPPPIMEWSEENALKFIEIYKTKSLLWDLKHKDHYKKNLKKEAWEEISDEMKISAAQCRKKMVSLLASYRRERNKVKSARRTGKRRVDIYESRWLGYEAFKFLEHRNPPRKRLITEKNDMIGIETEIDEGVIPPEQIKQEITQTEEEASQRVQEITPSEQVAIHRNETTTRREQATTHRERETPSSFSSPRLTKRTKVDGDISSSMMKIAFNMLQTAEKKLQTASQPDEIDSFFTYVAAKVQKYTPETQKTIQHAIFDILMKADKGMFDCPSTSYQHSLHWSNPAESGPFSFMYAPPFSQQQQEKLHPDISYRSESSLSSNSEQSHVPSNASESFEDFV